MDGRFGLKQRPTPPSWRRAVGAANARTLVSLALLVAPATASAASEAPPPIEWQVVFGDGFEGGLGQWIVDSSGDVRIEPMVTTFRAHSGTASAYPTGGGPDGVPPPGPYRGRFFSRLTTRPFDLSRYRDAYVVVWFWERIAEPARHQARAVLESADGRQGVVLPLSSVTVGDLASDPTSAAGWRKAVLRVPRSMLQADVVLRIGFSTPWDAWYDVGSEGIYLDDIRVIGTQDEGIALPSQDPYSGEQWDLRNRGQVARCGSESNVLGLPEAWNAAGPVDPEMIVAVVGDGVEANDDLVLDPGIDALNGKPGGAPREWTERVGTAAAGFIGAKRDDGIGVVGVAPGARILPVYLPTDAAGSGLAQAVERAVARGAKVLLVTSAVTTDAEAFRAAVERAVVLGRVVVAPAGDATGVGAGSHDTGEACRIVSAAGGICVGASSPSDEYKGVASCDGLAFWSSAYAGHGPDLVAPGVAGCTTDRAGGGGYNQGSWQYGIDDRWTCEASGTAFAAARVAGLAALMLTASPTLSPAQVRDILVATARDIDDPGPDDRTGAGRVDAAAAVREAAQSTGDTHPIPFLESIEPSAARVGTQGLELTLRGAGFVPESVALWDGEPRPTTFVSARELRAEIGAADLADQRVLEVSVGSPPPGGGIVDLTVPFAVDGDATVFEPAAPIGLRCVSVGQPAAYRVTGAACHPARGVEYQLDFGDDRYSDWIPAAVPAARELLAAHRPSSTLASNADDAIARRQDAERLLPELRERGTLRVIVELTEPASVELAAYAVGPARRYETLPLAALTVDEAGLIGLAGDAPVRRIWRDELRRPTLWRSVPSIGAPRVWALGPTGRGQAIAVLDTGVDAAHPVLAGRVSAEACFSTNDTTYSAVSLCPDRAPRAEGPGTAAPCLQYGCEHGTHVAGIAAGDQVPLRGVAPGATIVALQVFTRFDSVLWCGSSAPCVMSFVSDQIAALDWLLARYAELGVVAVNMSLGGGVSSVACDDLEPTAPAIAALREAGVATVVSSGNDGSRLGVSFPACVSSAISVGAVDADGVRASFSNIGPQLTLHAPGVEVWSALPGGGHAKLSGTSMAAPHVAGAVALLRETRPDASVDELVAALRDGGVANGPPSWSYGLAPRLSVPQAWGLAADGSELQIASAWNVAANEIALRARARCAAVPGAVSAWSEVKLLKVQPDPTRAWPPILRTLTGPVYVGHPLTLEFYPGSVGNGGCNDTGQYELDWGDGATSGWLPPGQPFGRHTYEANGTFPIRGRTRAFHEPSIVSAWSEPVTVTVTTFTAPDLRARWTSLKRNCSGKGAKTNCRVKGKLVIENAGNESLPGASFQLALRSATGRVWIGAATSVPRLTRGATVEVSVRAAFPRGEKGTGQFVVAVLDPRGLVEELDEANNEAVFGPLR